MSVAAPTPSRYGFRTPHLKMLAASIPDAVTMTTHGEPGTFPWRPDAAPFLDSADCQSGINPCDSHTVVGPMRCTHDLPMYSMRSRLHSYTHTLIKARKCASSRLVPRNGDGGSINAAASVWLVGGAGRDTSTHEALPYLAMSIWHAPNLMGSSSRSDSLSPPAAMKWAQTSAH
jgi:hypothetical protein